MGRATAPLPLPMSPLLKGIAVTELQGIPVTREEFEAARAMAAKARAEQERLELRVAELERRLEELAAGQPRRTAAARRKEPGQEEG